jgi:hypothetical protein
MTFRPRPCRFSAIVDGQALRLSGYALSDEVDELDLFVGVYSGVDEPRSISVNDATAAAEQCGRFLALSARGGPAARVDETHDAFPLISTIAAWPGWHKCTFMCSPTCAQGRCNCRRSSR